MKKSILLLAMAAFVLTGRMYASSVSQQQAQNIALNYFKIEVPTSALNPALAVALVYTQTETDGTPDFYVFNASPMKGFVIVSADNNAQPVIAYSSESNFVSGDFSKIGLSDWMKKSAAKIHYVVANNILADANIQNQWTSYAQGVNPMATRASTVGPLMTTTWNQNPYYDALCPPAALPSSSASKAVTGCVATAMAQIMKYWNYPAQGTGSNSYNDATSAGYSENYGTLTADFTRPLHWSAMHNNVTTDTDPVDSLMYELGVAVDMDYSPTGSGAYVLSSEVFGGMPCSQTVYVNNFYYNPNTIQGVQLASYTTATWIALMENEINSGRVVQYEGDDPTEGGHTWVMDGYEPQASGDLLHMNWGWGGAENGWFAVNNLSTPGFNPSQNDAALIGIEPLLPYSLTLTPTSPSICPSGSTTLTAHGPANATYSWSPATGLSCTTCANPTATPSNTTLYTVTVDSGGVSASMSVAVTVTGAATANFSYNAAASCSLPENVSFINSSTNSTSYIWDFGDGSTSTNTAPQHSYTVSGTYTLKLYASNACGVDSLIQNQVLQISGGAPVGTGASICSGQTATVTATGSNLTWYADAAATTTLNTGNVYITPNLTSTNTYYVNSSVAPTPVAVGPATDAIGGTGVFNTNVMRGLTFDCSVEQTLNSVVVYTSGAGDRTFVLEDSLGNVLDSATISLYNGQQTAYLYFDIPVGTGMVLGILGTANMIRNTDGAIFPYVSTDGTVSITGNNAAAAGRYYFFYDWQLQQASCTTPLTAVTVYVLSSGSGAFVATGTGSPTVTFSPDDQTATTYAWNFGDGSTSTQMNPVHTYANAGTYTVELVISNGTCSDTITRSINTAVLAGINELTAFSSLSVYPNPANNAISLGVNSSKAYNDCQLGINNMLGQNVYAKNIDLASGANTINMDISNLTAGVYFISLQNGNDVVTTKFVKE